MAGYCVGVYHDAACTVLAPDHLAEPHGRLQSLRHRSRRPPRDQRLIHIVNTLLLFALLRSASNSAWPSGLAAALFALHPLHVESVAWVSGRPGLLSTMFALASLWVYARYTRRRRVLLYLLVAVLMAFSLMAKPDLVTLPLVMLMIDFWPLDRWCRQSAEEGRLPLRGLIVEKVPLLALSAVAAVATLLVKNPPLPGTGSAESLPGLLRVTNAVGAYGWYIWKMIWPMDLAAFYPHPYRVGGQAWNNWQILLAGTLLLGVTAWVTRSGAKRYAAVGWFWYLVVLLPVIGLFQAGMHVMTDRYTYVPLVGLFIIIAWTGNDLLVRRRTGCKPVRIAAFLVVGSLLSACTFASYAQARTWRHSIALYEHALAVSPGSALARYLLGIELEAGGDLDAAIEQWEQVVAIEAKHLRAHFNLGVAYRQQNRIDEAVRHFEVVLTINPNDAEAHRMLDALRMPGDASSGPSDGTKRGAPLNPAP